MENRSNDSWVGHRKYIHIKVLYRSGLRNRESGWRQLRSALPVLQVYIPVVGHIHLEQRGRSLALAPGAMAAVAPFHSLLVHCPQSARYLHLRLIAQGGDGHDVLPLSQLPLAAPLGTLSAAALPYLGPAFTAWDQGQMDASLRLQGLVSLLLADLREAMGEASADHGWLGPALQRLAAGIDDPDLRIDDVAAAVGCSADWFTRRCRAELGITPKRLLLQRRLERACVLLIDQPQWSIAAVAKACGFRQAQHFHAVFAQHYAMSPGRWRDDGSAG